MPAMEPLCYLMGSDPKYFSKEEYRFLEIKLFFEICHELKELFREQYKAFFQLLKLTSKQEDTMLEQNFIQFILKDILYSGEYTLEGIARYTDIHEDVIQDLASGLNTQPVASYLRKIIELHRSVRIELYQAISQKLLLSMSMSLK